MHTYRYRAISSDPDVPLAPVMRVVLGNPDHESGDYCKADALFNTGADRTLIPFEILLALNLPVTGNRVSVVGTGGVVTMGFPCQMFMMLGELNLPLVHVVACEAAATGGKDRMIVGRDVLVRLRLQFDGTRQEFSFV